MADEITDEIIEDVLKRTAEGEMLTVICRSMGFSHALWRQRCKTDIELAARFAEAQANQYEAMAEGAVEFLEQEPEHTVVLNSKNEVLSSRVDTGYVAWQKARFDSRVRMLGFWAPHRYGEAKKIDVGGQLANPVQIEDKRDPATLALAIAAALRAKKRDSEAEPPDDLDIEDLI